MVNRESLVSISEACRILGVSEATLRQWTDEGKMKAFVTPGGHRRYSPVQLKKLISAPHRPPAIKDLATGLEGSAHLHGELSRAFIDKPSWYGKITEDSQRELIDLSRRMLHLITRHIAEPAKREETLREARDIGQGFGETLAQLGLPLTDSVEAFILHRAPVMSAISQVLKGREALNGRVVEAVPRVAHVMDEALLSLVAAHQRCIASRSGKAIE